MNKLIAKFAPSAVRSCSLSEFAGKTFAIDAYGLLHAYKVVHGNPTGYLGRMYDLCSKLPKEQIDAIAVMDGKGKFGEHQPDKHAARTQRTKNKISATNRLTEREIELNAKKAEHLKFTEQVDTSNIQNMTLEQKQELEALINSIAAQEQGVTSVQKQLISINNEDVEAMSTLFQAFGFGVATSEHEGEAGCVQLVIRGAADIVVANDTDAIVWGDVPVLQNLTNASTMRLVTPEMVRQEMGFTREEFVDMCILCGCDFSEKLIGLASLGAHREIKAHRTIEGVIANCPKYRVPDKGWTPDAARYTFLKMPCEVQVVNGVRDKLALQALFTRYNVERELTDEEDQEINKAVAQRKYSFNQPDILSYFSSPRSATEPPKEVIQTESVDPIESVEPLPSSLDMQQPNHEVVAPGPETETKVSTD